MFGSAAREILDEHLPHQRVQPGGISASLHAGYEWWVADEWSIGDHGAAGYLYLSLTSSSIAPSDRVQGHPVERAADHLRRFTFS